VKQPRFVPHYGWATDGLWTETPWWHPYSWFGLDMRQRITINGCGHYDSWWHYGRSQRLAHELLRRTYATDIDPKERI
jgi:hypothetical protein